MLVVFGYWFKEKLVSGFCGCWELNELKYNLWVFLEGKIEVFYEFIVCYYSQLFDYVIVVQNLVIGEIQNVF